jgi:hypothetical protein
MNRCELFTLNCQIVLSGEYGVSELTLYQPEIYPRSPA